MQRVRVAVVGGGYGQQVLVPAFRLDPRASVDLICVSTQQRADELAKTHGIPRAMADWTRVVTDPAIDAIAISVPPALQPEITLAAARAGKHVFAEKPLAMTAAQASEMTDAMIAASRVGAIDFELRDVPAWIRAKELLASHVIGRIRHAYVEWRVETWAHRDPSPSWKREPETGGGTLNLFASHSLDAVQWMLGPIARVAARLDGAYAAESRVDAWLELADGTPVSIAIAADATGANEHRISVFGDDGSLVLENRSKDYAAGFTLDLSLRGRPCERIDLAGYPDGVDGRIATTGAVIRRFLDAIVDGAPMHPSFADGLATQRAIDAIRIAHRNGTWQSTN